jgi:hypothetical protein
VSSPLLDFPIEKMTLLRGMGGAGRGGAGSGVNGAHGLGAMVASRLRRCE